MNVGIHNNGLPDPAGSWTYSTVGKLPSALRTTRRPSESIAGPAGQGTLIAFVVEDIDTEFARIAAAGATVVTEPETEPWGERYCQFADPNGLVWQLVQWI